MAELAVLVLNWNGARWLEPCFDALLAQEGPCFEPWLVDNGSSDGSLDLVAQFDCVRTLRMPRNLGFGQAYNRAIQAIDAPLIALLNNDTQVKMGWLAALVEELEARPNAAAVGSKLLYMNRPQVVNHAGGGLTLLGAAYDVGFGQPDRPRDDAPRPVGCVTGAAMLLRRDAFLELGGFDDTYFAYFEDADLCWRWWLRGYEVRYTPQARALHAYGGSTGLGRLSPLRIEHCQTNRLQNMFKNLELHTLLRVLPISLLYDAMRVAELQRRGHREAARAHVRGTRHFLRLLPHALRQRRSVQATRLRSDQELIDKDVLTGVVAAAAEWQRIGPL